MFIVWLMLLSLSSTGIIMFAVTAVWCFSKNTTAETKLGMFHIPVGISSVFMITFSFFCAVGILTYKLN